MKKVKYDKDGWPEVIPYLDKDDFIHEFWIHRLNKTTQENLGLCGNQRCMVGWVGSVFHQNSLIAERYVQLSNGCREFLKKLAELSGSPFDDSDLVNDMNQDQIDQTLMTHVSNTFEGGLPEDDDRTPMDADLAAQIWGKAMRSFGYTEEVIIEYIDDEK